MQVVRFIVFAFLFVFPMSSFSVTESELKSVLYYKFAAHTQWPDSGSRSELVLGFYPPNPEQQRFLSENLAGKTVHNLPLKITGYRSLDEAKKAQLLVLGASENARLREVIQSLSGTQTLLVTDSATQTLSTMINLVRLPDNKISFEVHRPNVVFEGLSVDRDIILLGGSELDVAKLYKETEKELAKTKLELMQQITEIGQQKVMLTAQRNTIEVTKRDLMELQSRVRADQTKLDVNTQQLEKDNARLQQNQKALLQQSQEIKQQEALYEEKLVMLSEKRKLIDESVEFLEQQKSIIAQQAQKIRDQEQILSAKVDQIHQQENVITSQSQELEETSGIIERQKKVLTYQYVATASLSLVVFLAVCAAFIYIRSSRRLTRSNQKLSRMTEELKEASKAKSMFLSTMSHEIRTPMNGVIGMADLLAASNLSSEQLRQLRVIQNSGKVLVNVINDILDFSKIEAGKLDVEEIDFNPESMISDACSTLVPLCRDKGLSLSVLIDPEIPSVLAGDPARISQIVTNFMSNAIKFTEEGMIKVIVKAVDGRWRIEVTDSGCGMSEEQVQRVFDAFTQAEKSITRRYGGTGLGLTISRKLAELMGGTVGLESELGVGSHIWLDLPLTAAAKPYKKEAKPILADSTVLVSVESEEVQELLIRYLGEWGMSVKACADGAVLMNELALLKKQQPSERATVITSDTTLNWQDETVALQLEGAYCVCLSLKLQLDYLQRVEVIDAVLESPITASRLYDCLADLYGMPHADSSNEKTIEQLSFDGARVLVAEDNKVNQMVIKGLLVKRGIDPVIVNDGQEAIDTLAKQRFDLVLMDCEMPLVDGYQATEIHRSRETLHRTPIVALTAHAMAEHRTKAELCGMDGHLAKPINQTLLDRYLSQYCKG